MASDRDRERRLALRDDLAQLRALADKHAALAHQFQAIHAEFLLLHRHGMPPLERQAQTDEFVRAESALLAQVQHVRYLMRRFLAQNR
jgi:hypothetical protein